MMYRTYAAGIIEVITGPMFSGKSEELIKRIKILGYAKVKTLVIKPHIDTRWVKEKIISRAGISINTVSCQNTEEIKKEFAKGDYQAMAIDEIQFFDSNIVDYIVKLANRGIRVIVSGLDQDFTGKPFEPMPRLLALADIIDKQHAVCNVCGKAGTMTYRLSNDKEQVAIGNKEYEPRCRECHFQGMKNKIVK